MLLKKLPLCSVLLGFAAAVHAEPTTLAQAISGGEAHLNFRYRYELVDQDGISNDAKASTIRTRLNYKTKELNGFGFFVELDDLSYLGDDDFNNTRNGKSTYPVVADPAGTDFNQLLISFNSDKNAIKLGRQRINHDGQRFVGGVGWRQNEQTYDAFTVKNTAIENVIINYSYLNKINRIFGPDDGAAAKEFDSNSHLLNVKVKLDGKGAIGGYAYFMDFENAAALSNSTLGLHYSNVYNFENFNMPINVEYARQQDYADNVVGYSASYYLLEAGLSFDSYRVLLGKEVLEGASSPGKAFRTPLATLHKFQGWSDKFLATPAGGMDDVYITFGASINAAKLALTVHDFSSETGSVGYGTEWDFALNYKFNKRYAVLFKVANYDADNVATDTLKTWLMFSANF